MASHRGLSQDEYCISPEEESWTVEEEIEDRLKGPTSSDDFDNQLTLFVSPCSFSSQNLHGRRTRCSSSLERRRWHKSLTVLQIVLVLLMSLPVLKAEETCSRKLVQHTFRYNGCIPARRLATICHGGCQSYSMINPEDPTSIQRSCSCCQAVDFRETRVPLRCPKSDGSRGYMRAVINVMLPMDCMCRPCDSLPDEIQPAEFLS